MTKAERYYREIREDRFAWRDSMPQQCMRCHKPFWGFRWPEIHEILSRAQAPNNWWHRCNALLLCNPCHNVVQNMPHVEQLAIKKRADPEHFDLQEWLRLRNPRAMRYVTEEEIESCR